ncbi:MULTISPECIES: DUF2550 family protein [Barrientosiimonas]|uniref:DUF2550 domain-containing protein n=1 Tax=Barrientosiimonas endolithica TaxID=1535208 RepID=A0ABN6YJY0_9MICO|nr:DUF2550 family protein [Barrientosiimonas endolithica]BDZ57251.1 hypothetical protein GCM10025872_09080 [Barrientosiimonas endolithica]
MGELVVTGEILGGLLLLFALILALLLLRRSRISRGGPMVLMSLHRDGSWRSGMARVGGEDIAWFPLFGVTTRPAAQWERGRLALGVPRDSDYRPTGMPDPVLVPFELPEQTVDVVLSRADYTAVRSWSESAPPGLNANNVA